VEARARRLGREPEGRRDGIVEAPRKAKFVVAGIKSPGQRAGPEKVLLAVETKTIHAVPASA
jgi:hypothetical protein